MQAIVGRCGLVAPTPSSRSARDRPRLKSSRLASATAASPARSARDLPIPGTCFAGSGIVIHFACCGRCGPSSQALGLTADHPQHLQGVAGPEIGCVRRGARGAMTRDLLPVTLFREKCAAADGAHAHCCAHHEAFLAILNPCSIFKAGPNTCGLARWGAARARKRRADLAWAPATELWQAAQPGRSPGI
jgi:hypothetical protein